MSNNFYATYAVHAHPDVKLTFHIGQTAAGRFTMSTVMFPSVKSMFEFIEHNADKIEIRDESESVLSIADVRALVYSFPRYETIPQELVRYRGFTLDPEGFLALEGTFL